MYSGRSNFEGLRSGRKLIAGSCTLLLTGYAVGYLLRPDGIWDGIFHFHHPAATLGESSAIYILAAVLALLLFLILLRSSHILPFGRTALIGRSEKPIGQFVEEAKELGIGLRVARESYHLLQHYYPRPMCVDFNDQLRGDLRLTPENILSLWQGLMARTDRIAEMDPDAGKLIDVRDLLKLVEAAPKNGVDRTTMRQRISDLPLSPRPVVENLPFTEASSLADPDFLRRAHFKWLRRRTADYKGFRSRAEDDGPLHEHAGPFRRGSELSRRLAISQEAGRLAKIAAKNRTAEEQRDTPLVRDTVASSDAGDEASRRESAAHQGY